MQKLPTYKLYSELSAVCDHNRYSSSAFITAVLLHLLHNLERLLPELAEDDVQAVKMRERLKTEEKLRSVGARAGVGHRQNAWACVLALKVFVCKLHSVDGFAASPVSSSEISSLSHKLSDDSVEAAALVVKGLS